MGAGPFKKVVDPIYTGVYYDITLVPSDAHADDRRSVDDKDWAIDFKIVSDSVQIGVTRVMVDEEGYCSYSVLKEVNCHRLCFRRMGGDVWTLPSFIARENDYITLRVSRRLTWVEA